MDGGRPLTRDLYRGRDRGRIYRITPKGTAAPGWVGNVSLAQSSAADLVAYLAHENRWWRTHAQRLLVDRGGNDAVGVIRELFRTSAAPHARVHALWTLEGLEMLERDDILMAMRDPVAGVRENGVLLAERHGAAAFEDILFDMVDDSDPRVRFQVLLTLGDDTTREAEAARTQILLKDLDDKWVQIASLRAGAPPTFAQLERSITALESEPRASSKDYVRRIAMLVGSKGSLEDVNRALYLVIDEPRRRMASEVLGGLSDGIRQRSEEGVLDQQRVDALTGVFFGEADAALRKAILQTFAAAKIEGPGDVANSAAIDVAMRTEEDADLRSDALDLLALSDPSPFTSDLEILIGSHPTPEVEAAAIRALGKTPAAEVADTLLERWPRVSVAGRDAALDAMMRSEERAHKLLDAVDSGFIAPSAFGWNRRVVLMRDWDGSVKERARRLLRVSEGSRADVLKRYQKSIGLEGDAANGRVVFDAACGSCHDIGGEGPSYGPDLGTVSHWSPHALVEAILVPSRIVSYGYELWRLERRSGDVLTGVLHAETSTAVTLALQGGVEITVPRNEIESLQQLDGSAMPEGLEEQISVEEMADMLAYLGAR